MTKTASTLVSLDLPVLITALLALPVAYFIISYGYLTVWHRSPFLWGTLIHENGRLTLQGSLFYFDHFIGCVPMVTLFALCTAGGFALSGYSPPSTNVSRAQFVAVLLIVSSLLIVLFAFIASVRTVGWQRTLDYALQRIERDGILSKGGNWNMLQLSNIPIALGTVALSSALVKLAQGYDPKGSVSLIVGGICCIGVAAALSAGITGANWCGWLCFLNPRWLAHSIREIATYPLTGIPIALASVALVERYISGVTLYTVRVHSLSLFLIVAGVVIVSGLLLALNLQNVNVLDIAQKPSFAPDGLSIAYLLSSHVFEHFLDFVLIGPLAGGVYALVRFLAL